MNIPPAAWFCQGHMAAFVFHEKGCLDIFYWTMFIIVLTTLDLTYATFLQINYCVFLNHHSKFWTKSRHVFWISSAIADINDSSNFSAPGEKKDNKKKLNWNKDDNFPKGKNNLRDLLFFHFSLIGPLHQELSMKPEHRHQMIFHIVNISNRF